jgi:hypothetical protein
MKSSKAASSSVVSFCSRLQPLLQNPLRKNFMQIIEPLLVFGHLEEFFQNNSENFSFGLICQCLWLSSILCFFLFKFLSASLSFWSRLFFPCLFVGGILAPVASSGRNFSDKFGEECKKSYAIQYCSVDPASEEFFS